MQALAKVKRVSQTVHVEGPGSVTLTWQTLGKKPVTVAGGTLQVSRAGDVKVPMKLTPKGVKLFKKAHGPLKLMGVGAFKPAGASAPVKATHAFTLKP
jgi:hypothetical protein